MGQMLDVNIKATRMIGEPSSVCAPHPGLRALVGLLT